MKIVADHHIPYVKEFFSAQGELSLKPGRAITHADVKHADLLLVRSVTPVDEALLTNTTIKFVGSVTAGTDHLDTAWLDAAGIPWATAAGFNAPPVADYVVSTIAALQRKSLLLPGLTRKAAVIGVGQVGRLVAEKLITLGFSVLLCDPIRAEQEIDFVSTAIENISDVDLICLHVPLTKKQRYATYHLIDETFLRRQKLGCVLLNASRGAVIDTAALLQHGTHLHWCLDVFEHEPHINQTVLAQALITTPHIAGYAAQSKLRGTEHIYQAACAKKIMTPAAKKSPIEITMPRQRLTFAGGNHHWQDIVLGVFNPLIMTAMMKTQLLAANDAGHRFDELRHQFRYRHEFAFTEIDTQVVEADKAILKKLGFLVPDVAE
ncbi:MAG TPA: 4-phosphoerythronate dehydrogenase [Gammaproteobacteria bacterium]|jgi:erythronate-4-phosphate dehydrogenase|nr:4-phosphoerythronate dehydrogenase [Gammaproteobacteria bacterium]